MDWTQFNNQKMLATYAELMAELRSRGLVRSSNNPVADYTETLVASSLGLDLVSQSTAGHDAVDPLTGVRYQIKGRRLTKQNGSTQLGALRNLSSNPFEFLAAVVFNPDFSLGYAALIPLSVVQELSKYSKHTNSHVFHFKQTLLADPRIQTITARLKS